MTNRYKQMADEMAHEPTAILAQAIAGDAVGAGTCISDLSIDEVLAIHSVGYETVEFVTGTAVVCIPQGAWTFASGEITEASLAHHRAFELAAQRLCDECRTAGGEGVVGVDVRFRLRSHGVSVELTGTAIRHSENPKSTSTPFASDLSGQDFALLVRAGWMPLGLAVGASYVHIPRLTAGQFLGRVGQNVEMTQMTEALYAAREAAMERMQSMAIDLGGQGVVAVQVREGMLGSSTTTRSAVFRAYGTVVKLVAAEHQTLSPMTVLSLDDADVAFAPQSLD